MIRKTYILTMLFALSSFVGFCKNNKALQQIDELCNRLFPSQEPGAAVLILKNNKILFDKGYGIADIKTKEPINGDTFFNIASVSKQFTATAILQLVEQGKLSLEDPINKYYQDFKQKFWSDIKIKHLLSHSSGIPDARNGLTRQQRIDGDEHLALAYLSDLNFLHFTPGSNYEYINPTYVLLGNLVEKISGIPFTEYITKNIFGPAQMTSTLYFDRNHQELIPNMAHAYEYGDLSNMSEEHSGTREGTKDWYEYDFGEETFFATRPDGGIYTSTHQFVRWEKALQKHLVLSKASLDLAQTPHTLVSGSAYSNYQNRPNTWYGYGWFIEPQTDAKPLKIYHTGDNGGFKILAARYPSSNSLILIFANRSDWDRYKVMTDFEKILNI